MSMLFCAEFAGGSGLARSPGLQVVTDGLVDLVAPLERRPSLVVVPWQVAAKRGILRRDGGPGAEAVVGGTMRLAPPSHLGFLDAYRPLGSQRPVLSIHHARTLHPITHQARLARQLLFPQRNIAIFGAAAISLGLRSMVDASARASDEAGLTVAQTVSLLRRMQERTIRTFILAPGLGSLRNRISLSVAERLRDRLPWVESIVALDGRTGGFRLAGQGRGMAINWEGWDDLFRAMDRPCRLWIQHRGYGETLSQIVARVGAALRPEEVEADEAELTAAPFLPRRYVEILVHPSKERLEALIEEAKSA